MNAATLSSLVSIVAVAVDLTTITASSDDESATRETFEAIYAGIDAAYETADLDSIAARAAPDATVVWMSGNEYPFREWLEYVAGLDRSQAARRLAARSTIASIETSGTDIVVAVRSEHTGFLPHSQMSYVFTTHDTWTRSRDGWVLTKLLVKVVRLDAPSTDAETAVSVAADLRRHAAALTTVEAGHASDDLAAFGKAVGNARIVALGEATHWTREFFQMKHRLLEYLVREKGFTVFAIEANWPESLAVDRYIKTGEGDPKAALAAMYFWTWNTEEVLDMIEWMRAYNKAASDHPILSFTSFDMMIANVAANRVLAYLRETAPSDATSIDAAHEDLRKLGEEHSKLLDDAATAGLIVKQLEVVLALLDTKREALVGASSVSAWRNARQAAEIVHQAATFHTKKGSNYEYRDEMMARNVEWLANEDHPDEKIILWAHNAHVNLASVLGNKPTGRWLRERFGEQLYVVGFAFRGGEARAVGLANGKYTGLANHQVPRSPEGSGDAVLSAAGLSSFFLDMREVLPDSALGRWLSAIHLHRAFGSVFPPGPDSENYFIAESLRRSYDGLIFVEHGHAARGLPASAGSPEHK